jgi:alpha-1,2-mannosyltransferase
MALTPLAALPLWPAMALWCAATLGLYLWTCWRILPDPLTLAAALAAAPTAMILIDGQTGFLIAAILGLALLELDRRPVRAGLLLGLTGVKPHLVAAVPLALAATGRWRAIAGGLAMLALLAGLSRAALGGASWAAFAASLEQTGAIFTGTGAAAQRWAMGASLFSGLSVAGLPFGPAIALHGAAALAVLALLLRAWRDPGLAADLKAALVCYATLAVTPRVLSYDLHILLIGALFQVRHALARGWFRGEQPLLGLAALGAFVSLVFAPGIDPVLPLALFAACWLGHVRRRNGGPERPARGASHVEKGAKAL